VAIWTHLVIDKKNNQALCKKKTIELAKSWRKIHFEAHARKKTMPTASPNG